MSNTLKNIVIGTSLSESSDGIVRTAVAIAKATGATPWLAHVHSSPATSGLAPSPSTVCSSARRITSSAGQPRNVGVNSTRTVSPSTVTLRITPRSTSEMTGISGSGISSSAAQT